MYWNILIVFNWNVVRKDSLDSLDFVNVVWLLVESGNLSLYFFRICIFCCMLKLCCELFIGVSKLKVMIGFVIVVSGDFIGLKYCFF